MSAELTARYEKERPVVVGYHGRPDSRAALVWAAGEADRRRVPLLVVNAADYPGMTLGPGRGLLDPSPRGLEADEELTARGVAEALAVRPGLRVSGMTVPTAPVSTLAELAGAASVLVLGSRGHGRLRTALRRSVVCEVTARTRCPVVVVRSGRERPDGEVVVAHDGSPEPLGFAADHAAATSGRLLVVTATGEGAADQVLRAASNLAEEGRDAVAGTHPDLTVVTAVEPGSAERALVSASMKARLVVVGTRDREVLLGSRCPVAVVQPSTAPSSFARTSAMSAR
ncbi:Nucleotide-binding universal stress protein, UspA family [Lentzea fradiae]|uniref:Nucleotide-binding universal stress protein, UspA family n=1 Tax=Lentzea fradiae TaxID=200378 RepID=A0A1G7KWQ1_9PSEU|nr:universal stress protein [Lentzea fradiae]SDF41169.1 Nucleotide-binding universal stress protein, UspA family [Lentzea fradiae]